MNEQLLYVIGGILFSVLGFFLKDVIDEVKELKKSNNQLRIDLDVLKSDHVNKHTSMSEKIDELKDVVLELSKDIKELRREVAKKQ